MPPEQWDFQKNQPKRSFPRILCREVQESADFCTSRLVPRRVLQFSSFVPCAEALPEDSGLASAIPVRSILPESGDMAYPDGIIITEGSRSQVLFWHVERQYRN